jgi:hypothetical protein
MNKSLKNVKENHTAILEKLFNDIFHAPDLKKDILDYIQPEVLQAHELLNRHNVNNNVNTQDKTSSLSLEFEEHRQMENLLYRDLPNLVSDYISLDLSYRNEKKLKNNETHRQTLMQNLQFIVAKLNDLKESVFAGHDTKANTANQILEAKYGSLQTEVEPIESDSYNWSELKASLPQHYLEKTGFIQKAKKDSQLVHADTHTNTEQQKVTLVDGKIQYRAKNLKVAARMWLGNAKKTIRTKMTHQTVKKIKTKLVFPGIPAMMIIGSVSLFSMVVYDNATLASAKSTLSDVISAMNRHDTEHSRDEAMKILQKMTNEQSLYYHKNLTVSFAGKTVTATLSDINQSTCETLHDYLDGATIMTGGYALNNAHIDSFVQDKDQYAHDTRLCHAGSNSITVSEDMRTFNEQLEQMQQLAEKEALMQSQIKHQSVSNDARNMQKEITNSLIKGLEQGLQQSPK